MRELFTSGWIFYKGKVGMTLDEAIIRRDVFSEVDLPHDFAIAKYSSFYEDATAWYHKSWEEHKCSDNRIIIYFDGIYMDSKVYINGQQVCEWKYGYTQFEIDVTDYIVDGQNEIDVSVTYLNPNSRWYSGAGILRRVWIDRVPSVYIPRYGIYAHADKITEDKWLLTIDTQINGETELLTSADETTETIKYSLSDSDGNTCNLANVEKSVLAKNDIGVTLRHTYEVNAPKLWDVDSPNLYCIEAVLFNGHIETTEFGFRQIEITPDKGLFLNGRHLKINGVCEHHDFGMLGGAFFADAMERKLINLKNMGANSVRFSHNPVDAEAMLLCDRLGLLVMSEAFDMWEHSKTPYDYARFFKNWHKKDVSSWVRQDRNHPSLLMWSIGNEIYDIHLGERGREIVNELSELVREFDPLHNGYITFCSNYMPWENAQKAANDVELVGYNYAERYYEEHHDRHPDWAIYGSETSSIAYSRGVYHFPLEAKCLSDDDGQCSALGNSTTSWGAKSIEECICFDRDTEYSLGQYIWAGHDYLGEPTPYHSKNSFLGIIDTAGYPKDPYYCWQCEWTYGDKGRIPRLYITPDWDYNVGQLVDVRIYTNADEVELFLNGVSLGRRILTHDKNSGYKIIADYKVCYEEGILLAIGYDKNGKEIVRSQKQSYKDTVRLKCTRHAYGNGTEVSKGHACEGKHLEFYDIVAIDANGNEVENASDYISVSTAKTVKLLALDNGDSTDYTDQQSTSKRLFKGKLLAVIEVSDDMPDGEDRISVAICQLDIPVRRIDMRSLGGSKLSSDNRSVDVAIGILPANATDREITYRLTDQLGNDTNIAKITSRSESLVTIEALGDGDFQLRAFSKSGTEAIRVVSQLDFSAAGLGKAFYDAYTFVSGSTYANCIGTVGAGNDRGVATARGEQTVVIFDNIDFGRWGSSEITIPIFALDFEKINIDIYDGVWGTDGCELICEGIYNHPKMWNVYQEETFKLTKRLKGVHSLSFRTTEKIHMKGFYCGEYEPAHERLYTSDALNIYGDTYIRRDDAITNIGNNVTIDFGDIDFGNEVPCKVCICGRARGSRNTIHIRFEGSEGEVRNIMECDPTDEYVESTFAVKDIARQGGLQLIFLPGCDYDLKWIRFSV